MRLALAFGVVALALGCTDVGLVGQDSVCRTTCAAGERCDPELKACVRCMPGTTCEPSEPSICKGEAERGDRECVACRGDSECDATAPFCHDGRCGECIADDDCSPNSECEDQRCKLSTDLPDEPDDLSGAGGAGAQVDAGKAVEAGTSVDAGGNDESDGTGGEGSDDP
jgi:hypothetical protein